MAIGNRWWQRGWTMSLPLCFVVGTPLAKMVRRGPGRRTCRVPKLTLPTQVFNNNGKKKSVKKKWGRSSLIFSPKIKPFLKGSYEVSPNAQLLLSRENTHGTDVQVDLSQSLRGHQNEKFVWSSKHQTQNIAHVVWWLKASSLDRNLT